MNNPFLTIEAKLNVLEDLLLDLVTKSDHPVSHKPKDEILDVQGAADFLHLTPATIYTKVSKGVIPYMKVGKRLYFSKENLIAYLKKGSNLSLEYTTDNAIDFLVSKKVKKDNC